MPLGNAPNLDWWCEHRSLCLVGPWFNLHHLHTSPQVTQACCLGRTRVPAGAGRDEAWEGERKAWVPVVPATQAPPWMNPPPHQLPGGLLTGAVPPWARWSLDLVAPNSAGLRCWPFGGQLPLQCSVKTTLHLSPLFKCLHDSPRVAPPLFRWSRPPVGQRKQKPSNQPDLVHPLLIFTCFNNNTNNR